MSGLPTAKKEELDEIVKIIKGSSPVEAIIMFGSHARGDWVSDRYKQDDVTYEYKSDFDILVLVKNEKVERNRVLWNSVQKDLLNNENISTPVSLLVDTLSFVNKKISEGNYFYVDVKKEGRVLYNTKDFKLKEPHVLSPKKRKENAQRNYDFWMGKAQSFLKDYKHNINDKEYNNAAFHLSQSTEGLFFAVLLVFTGYKPKSHNLERISEMVCDILPEFSDVFPLKTDKERVNFDLLKKAYIDARYKQDYKVEKEALEYLYERILVLDDLVKKVCEEKIKEI